MHIFVQLLIICKKISTFALTKQTTVYETDRYKYRPGYGH